MTGNSYVSSNEAPTFQIPRYLGRQLEAAEADRAEDRPLLWHVTPTCDGESNTVPPRQSTNPTPAPSDTPLQHIPNDLHNDLELHNSDSVSIEVVEGRTHFRWHLRGDHREKVSLAGSSSAGCSFRRVRGANPRSTTMVQRDRKSVV